MAHVGMRGLGQLSNGWEVLPLCWLHHGRGNPMGHHDLGKRFWTVHGLDRYLLIREYQRRYFLETGKPFVLASPTIRASRVRREFDREG